MKQTKLRYLGFTLAAVLAMLLIGLSFSRFGQHKRPTAGVNKPLIVRPTQPEPPAVKLPPPTASDVVHAVEAAFRGTVVIPNRNKPKFLLGDFNGDGYEDLAVIVRPDPEKLEAINSETAGWIIRDPRKIIFPKPGQSVGKETGRRKPEKVRPSDVMLAVVHGVGPMGWRGPLLQQVFLLRNVAATSFAAERSPGLVWQPGNGDVIRETLAGSEGYVYWVGTGYAWQPILPVQTAMR